MSTVKSFISKHLLTFPDFRLLFSEFYGKLYLLHLDPSRRTPLSFIVIYINIY